MTGDAPGSYSRERDRGLPRWRSQPTAGDGTGPENRVRRRRLVGVRSSSPPPTTPLAPDGTGTGLLSRIEGVRVPSALSWRSGAARSARRSHKPQVVGSNPTSATRSDVIQLAGCVAVNHVMPVRIRPSELPRIARSRSCGAAECSPARQAGDRGFDTEERYLDTVEVARSIPAASTSLPPARSGQRAHQATAAARQDPGIRVGVLGASGGVSDDR